MNKQKLKEEYKLLVKAGNMKKAQDILKKIWDFNSEKPVKVVSKKKDKVIQEKKINLTDLYKINGVGKKTVSDIKKIYNSVEELKNKLSENKVPLRDDIVDKLKKFFKI